MSQYSIHPCGDKIKKAIQEFSDLIAEFPKKKRRQLLQQVELKYDLTPQECGFLNTHLEKEKN